MICPVKALLLGTAYPSQVPSADCIRVQCGWWDGENGCCAVLALAKHWQTVADQYEKHHVGYYATTKPPRVRRTRDN